MESWEIKNALEHYHQIHRARDKAKDKLEMILAKREKVGGSVVKIPEPSAMSDGMKRIVNMEKYDMAVAEYGMHKYYAALADQFIEWAPEPYRQMLKDKYVLNAKVNYLTSHYSYSPRQLTNIIDNLVNKFVELC